MDDVIFYRRNLPHLHPQHAIFFVTFRLAGTIPKEFLERLQKEKEAHLKELAKKHTGKSFQEEKYAAEKRFFARYDAWLDQCAHGPTWLKDESIA